MSGLSFIWHLLALLAQALQERSVKRKQSPTWHGFRYGNHMGPERPKRVPKCDKDKMQTEAGKEIFSYWLELTRHHPVPLQRDFEPARVRRHLPDLFILGKDEADLLSFRLAGTRLCAMFGHELRSRPFACIWHRSQRAQTDVAVQAVIARGQPVVTDIMGVAADGSHPYELVLLPMRSGDAQPDRILGAILSRQPRNSAEPESLSCLYAGTSRAIAEDNARDSSDSKRFSRFMRRLLSVEIVEDGLPGRR